MRLMLVVLPAPLGPISATVSFSCTVKLTSCTARRPPNRLLRPLITSASAIGLRPRRLAADMALPGFPHHAHQPGRLPQDHRPQDEAVARELDAADRAAEPALQQGRRRFQQYGADYRTPQGSDPADDRNQCGLDRDVEGKRGRGIDEVDILGVERAGECGKERTDHIDVAFY